MKYTIDQKHIRYINQRVILNQIVQTESISRATLSRLVHISKSAMTENIAALLSTGIIEEVGVGPSHSTGGRKPILLKFNRNYAYIVAIDLNYTDPIFVLANLGGDIINRFAIHVTPSSSYETRLTLVKNAVSALIASANLQNRDNLVIAISSPGIYNPATGLLRINEQFATWNLPELSRQLGAFFRTQVLVVNDVNAAAIGELHYGAGKGMRNLLYISCGLGLGAGLILNGALYEGSCNGAGEIANFIVPDIKNIHLEQLVNIDSLLENLRKMPPEELYEITKDPTQLDFQQVVQAWKRGSRLIDGPLDQIARRLGYAVCNMISLLNCDCVIFGGEYRVFCDRLLPVINEIIQQNAFHPVEMVASSLSHDSGIYGLFSLASEQIFDKLCSTPGTHREFSTSLAGKGTI